ncbi:HlyD family type I secretion periplasmic adaptor subunit [Oricola thermophila]|uniref:Membrane fusion protein (MFP) family protein n=1 Tax=Oricola thermophila TaxID=2742145 RepID=A0A6N1V904_9HYPH|nr:HlyD family type I secretion periplasmic adaptor subunit [Oricola thermophila]QKV16983.1 HlyD family type I secretion periplasmic adaptor subunit [Oricola thermophila]
MIGERPSGSARAIVLIVVAMIASFAVWASQTEIDEIARGEGRVIPASRTQTIQATEAGVVKEIAVQIGQVVKEGQLIIRLDDTTTASDLGEVEARARALKARVARLEVEEAGNWDDGYACPADVAETAPSICENEERLLAARRAGFRNTEGVLQQRLLQRRKELDEANANLQRLLGSLEISKRELALIEPMAKRRLVAETELIRAQRAINEVEGEIAALNEMIPRLQGAISEAELQLKELELQFRQEALTQKTDVLAELSVLEESARGEMTRVSRTDIRSPVDGVINTMEINTIGSFVQPGAVIAEVVPTSEELLVEARISPRDVAFVVPGQPALVKITAFDFSIYGGLEGEVVNVSPDSIVDQKTGEPYFEVRIKTDSAQLRKDENVFNITPGMICTVDIITGRKTILHYLLKPINKARQEAFTER